MMDKLTAFLQREPVWIAALVRQGITVGVAFGLKLSAEQIAVLMGFVELVTTIVSRAYTTPNARLAWTDPPVPEAPATPADEEFKL
jgi:hypothetical protein